MKKRIVGGQIVEMQPFGDGPDDFIFYVRDRWLVSLDERPSTGRALLDDRLISYLEYEAAHALAEKFPELPQQPVIDRKRPTPKTSGSSKSKFSSNRAPTTSDTYEAAFERWRSAWAVEVRHHEPFTHSYPKKIAAAINILIITSRLRSAVESKDSERAAALGMLLAFEAIGGGYGHDLESKIESKKAREKKLEVVFYSKGAGAALPDLRRANDACVRLAGSIWTKDKLRRMGDVVDDCYDHLDKHLRQHFPKLDHPPKLTTIRDWLKAAGKAGRLVIPPEAQRPGAGKKN